MKAQKKISYSEDVDILMIQFSNKKIDDAYDVDNMIVQVDQDGEPVLIEIFHGKQFLQDLINAVPKKIQKKIWSTEPSIAVPHRVK